MGTWEKGFAFGKAAVQLVRLNEFFNSQKCSEFDRNETSLLSAL
jgi:hypothetical protein